MSTHATASTTSNHIRTTEIADLLARLAVLMFNQRSDPDIPESRPIPTRVLLTIEEAAEKLGIGRTLMCKLIRTGDVESVLIGRLRRIHIDAVNSYAEHLVAEQRAVSSVCAAVRRDAIELRHEAIAASNPRIEIMGSRPRHADSMSPVASCPASTGRTMLVEDADPPQAVDTSSASAAR